MKKRIITIDDIQVDTSSNHPASLQDAIIEFILKHPKCTRRDIYSLPFQEGHLRRSLLTLLKSNKVRETFTIQ